MDSATAWTPLRIREVRLANRVWFLPMCQYSAEPDGVPTVWHLAHYGARAAGGAGLVVVECTGIAPDMRTTRGELGLWNSDQLTGHRTLADAIRSIGSVPGLQLGAAERKTSHGIPWNNAGTRTSIPPSGGGWEGLAPSPIPFAGLAAPRAMSRGDGARVLEDLARSAVLADRAGYEVLEFHGANGYLLHQFLSSLSNHRVDDWGGDLAGGSVYPLEMIEALLSSWPEHKPLLVRLPATDLLEGGLSVDDMILVAGWLHERGVDMIDIGSGALVPEAPRHLEPLYNARFGPDARVRSAHLRLGIYQRARPSRGSRSNARRRRTGRTCPLA